MYHYIQRIRDYINEHPFKCRLLKNLKLWNQLCSSMDVVEDAELAIDNYLDSDLGKGDGEKYLRIYGVLQALFIQQNAVMHLIEALGFRRNLEKNSKLKTIREIRNDSVGHPTKRGNYKSYHFISRPTISKNGFQLMSVYENNKTKFRNISVNNLIEQQRLYLKQELVNIIKVLEKKKKAHKERFKMEKLVDIFSSVDYYCEKIFENLGKDKQPKFGCLNVKLIQDVLNKFKAALKRRDMKVDTYLYGYLEYSLSELSLYFKAIENKKKRRINDKTAHIFAFYVREHIRQVKKIAQEIDKDYSS